MSTQNLTQKPQSNNPQGQTPKSRRRLTRRQFLQTTAVMAGFGVGLPVLPKIAASEAADATPASEAPAVAKVNPYTTPAPTQVRNVETIARIPNRAGIVNPATLADYCAKMETYLNEQAEQVKGWTDEREVVSAWCGELEPTLEEYLRNEIYALLDSLTALVVAAEKVGCGDVAREILTVDDVLNYAQCAQPKFLKDPKETGFDFIRDNLWGQKPPVMSAELIRFTVLKTVIGNAATGEPTFSTALLGGKL